jgi:hypothetical protein
LRSKTLRSHSTRRTRTRSEYSPIERTFSMQHYRRWAAADTHNVTVRQSTECYCEWPNAGHQTGHGQCRRSPTTISLSVRKACSICGALDFTCSRDGLPGVWKRSRRSGVATGTVLRVAAAPRCVLSGSSRCEGWHGSEWPCGHKRIFRLRIGPGRGGGATARNGPGEPGRDCHRGLLSGRQKGLRNWQPRAPLHRRSCKVSQPQKLELANGAPVSSMGHVCLGRSVVSISQSQARRGP